MVGPKRSYTRSKRNFCKNPECGARLDADRKYCDETCRSEASRLEKLARRPASVRCAFCNTELDVLSRTPADWKRSDLHFCDEICKVGHNNQTGFYERMADKGKAAIKEYKEKHNNKVHNYENRAKRVSENNIKAPPKAKHFERSGVVWGWDAIFTPNSTGDGYLASIPELAAYISPIPVKTKKEGLLKLREKFIELRLREQE